MSRKIHETAYLAPGCAVVGDVEIGRNASVWFNATVRGDSPIRIGENSNVQDNAVLHGERGHEINVGDGVTIGHGAIVHGCKIGNCTLIGMGAIIMNGAEIGSHCLIGAGALVTGGMVIPDGSLVVGSPARIVSRVSEDQIRLLEHNASRYVELAAEYAAEYS